VRFHNCPGCQRHITANATEELKLDGYRSIAFKTGGKVYLRSRNDKDFNATYPDIVKALAGMPDETVIDDRPPLAPRVEIWGHLAILSSYLQRDGFQCRSA
jgi:ATP dependent DNA ligase domain